MEQSEVVEEAILPEVSNLNDSVMNLFSQGLFSQFVHFGGYDVLSLLTLIQLSSIFSLIVCMDKIYVSDEQFFPLSNHCYDN